MIKNLTIVLVSVSMIYGCSTKEKHDLPYYGKHTTATRNVAGKEIIDTVHHTIPDFELINQDSITITQKDIEGRVFVVDFIFASCPSICPVMTNQLVRVQRMTKDLDNFLILSYTVDPKRDSPERLKSYANKFACDTKNWHFLHGEKEMVYNLGMFGYYLSMGETPDSPGGFIHSPTFVLVDQQRHIRGMYNGTKANEVGQMVEDIYFLLK